MAINVQGLNNYTKDNLDQLISKSMFGQKFQSRLIANGGNVQQGIKTAERIHLLASDVFFAADSGCGFTASGDDTITARTITVGAIKVNKSFCPKDLKAKVTQLKLRQGSMAESDQQPIEQMFADNIVGEVAEKVEVALFQGDTDSGNTNPNTNKFDGLLKVAPANLAVAANTTAFFGTPATSFTTSNIRDAVMAVVKAFPLGTKTASDREIAIGTDLFELYVQSYVAANLFHFKPEQIENGELTIPGTAIKLVAYPGLNGTNKIIGYRWSNIWLGTDLQNEEEDFKFWVDGSDMETVKMKLAFKLGTQVAYPNQVVRFDLA